MLLMTRLLSNINFPAILILALCSTLPVFAQVSEKSLYNPKPAAGDIQLPIPDGEVIVFRKIEVPGSSFWGDLQRIIQLGDASGGIFEGLQRLQISGSFYQPNAPSWYYYLAKYELTKGQFIAVMGMDALLAASADPEDKKLTALSGKNKNKALGKPLTFVRYSDFLNFMNHYNHWLFDPEFPQRRQSLPENNGVPGFIRLPTEVEWEYALRGGKTAQQKQSFDSSLPFSKGKINKYVWHLGNAKHKLRPIGLRKPNALGLYDMLGNAQEIVDGRFYPEIWQGKPGGVPVRGGSVSTAKNKIRSSLREELDIWAWSTDDKKMTERRSYNTGIRLSIGSNVVVNTAQKEELTADYESYQIGLRAKTPVGQTLANLVAQADQNLTNMDPIMQRLMEQNPNLQSDLAAIQHYLDQARQRLDNAQQEAARSLAQDAIRNGVIFSVYLSRQQRLNNAMEKARELLEVSTRYQRNVDSIQKQLNELNRAMDEQFQGYQNKLLKLGDYENTYIAYAFKHLQKTQSSKREQSIQTILQKQITAYRIKRQELPVQWREDIIKLFSTFKD